MPTRKSGKHRSLKTFGDVTLNDFANSTVCKNRPKKSSESVTKVLKQFQEEEKSWDEKPDDFDGEFVVEEDEDGNITYVLRKVDPRRRRKTVSSSEEVKEMIGRDYPIDIWFLLSEYIRPEDIGHFASICKTSFEVVCTAKFWFGLYKRYYNSVSTLPEELQPECLVRKYGLRTCVIRALYHMYPPFVNRIKSRGLTVEQHPDLLKRRLCDCLWHQKHKEHWRFYFKMREKRENILNHSYQTDKKKPDLLEILDDVSANTEENCCILQVTCKDFIAIPPVLGQVLISVSVTLSSGLRYNRLQLDFGSAISAYRKSDSNCTSIILEPVVNYKILDWWHPQYPYRHNIQNLFN
nr:unnamed protein product [Callosobruchus analis]